MRPSVSIVMPLFNAEGSLPSALQTILTQIESAPEIDWQVVCVNDGSTDNSLQILESWQDLLPMQIETIAQSGSPAHPRNVGVSIAQSEYIFFLDADDILLNSGLSSVVHFAVKHNSDVVVCRLKSLDGRGVPRGMFLGDETNVKLTQSRIYWALNPMKLIRKELIIQNHLNFYENFLVGEDQPFALNAYIYAKKISTFSSVPVVGIKYTDTRTNFSLTNNPPESYFALVKEMLNILKLHNFRKTDIDFLAIRHWEIEFGRELIWNNLPMSKDSELEKIFEVLTEFADMYLPQRNLVKISVRWRGIVRLIKNGDYKNFQSLVNARRKALISQNIIGKILYSCHANLIRLRFLFNF